MINENVLKGNWKVLKGEIQKKWSQLTDDDLGKIEGDTNKLLGLLQKKMGYQQEEARQQLHKFLQKHDLTSADESPSAPRQS